MFLLSAAMASTSMLISGSAGAFLSGPGPAPDVVILSGGGRVPETGSVDLSAVQNATRVPGVTAASPEVYAPVELMGRVAVVRGVNMSDFAGVQGVSFVGGANATLDGSTVFAGSELAVALGVGAGSTLTLVGVMANYSSTVRVAAVVNAGPPYGSELISTIQLAQALRGLSSSQVTFERLKVDPAVFNETALIRAVGGARPSSAPSGTNPLIQQLQLAPTATLVSIFPAGAPAASLSTVLGRGVGVVQATFESLEAVVLLASLLAVYFAASYWLESVGPTAATLGALGMGGGRELRWYLTSAVPGSLGAGALGYVSAYAGLYLLAGGGSLSFFFQPILIPFDPSSLAVACLGPATAVAASIGVSVGAKRGRL
ncbi:MAG: hypothetical protein KGI26_04005 [Thaumarchaeota archaeon]|nr:hypothetical protein [Nitrososphaerota archaeon]